MYHKVPRFACPVLTSSTHVFGPCVTLQDHDGALTFEGELSSLVVLLLLLFVSVPLVAVCFLLHHFEFSYFSSVCSQNASTLPSRSLVASWSLYWSVSFVIVNCWLMQNSYNYWATTCLLLDRFSVKSRCSKCEGSLCRLCLIVFSLPFRCPRICLPLCIICLYILCIHVTPCSYRSVATAVASFRFCLVADNSPTDLNNENTRVFLSLADPCITV